MTKRIARWTCTFARTVWMLALIGTPRVASAQFTLPSEGSPPAEDYHIEGSGSIWLTNLAAVMSSEVLGIAGDDIDLVRDLGIDEGQNLNEFRLVLRAARKHKFKLRYSPLSQSASTTLTREFVFNGLRYPGGTEVATDFTWQTLRFGYEWDFVRRDWGYVGFMLDGVYINSKLDLSSSIGANEFNHTRGVVPAFGFTGRGYPASFLSITGEISFFNLPENGGYAATHVDLDFYATINFARWVGAQLGYHHFDITYTLEDDDTGDVKLNGLYVAGVLRY